MKICIFNGDRLGIIDGDAIADCTYIFDRLKVPRYPLPRRDLFIEALPNLRSELEEGMGKAPRVPLDRATLESPVANPGKLIAAPVNYQAHLDEAIADTATFSRAHVRTIRETGLFLKATSSLVGPSTNIVLGFPDRRTDHEIELAVVIGRTAKRVPAKHALDYVAGYSIGLDITIRGPEERSLRKSLDTYSVLGPWLVTADEISNVTDLDLALDVNGEPRQRANTRDLIMSPEELIEFSSSFYTLEPGDVLFTGTPAGVGPILPGDTLSASISKIGTIRVLVEQ